MQVSDDLPPPAPELQQSIRILANIAETRTAMIMIEEIETSRTSGTALLSKIAT
jgi:hypothetical protein